jgi:hypothetical protein
MPDQVNVQRINGVFLKFLLQALLSQSGSYYLIETRVELDKGLVVNILSCARPLMGIFWKIGYSNEKYYRVRPLFQLSNSSRTVIIRSVREILKILH